MNKVVTGSIAGLLVVVGALALYLQSRKISELGTQLAALRQSQDDLAKRESAIDSAAPKQVANAIASLTLNPTFKGVVHFNDAGGKPAAVFDPADGFALVTPDNQRTVYLTAQNGGAVHAGSLLSVGSLSAKDGPGIALSVTEAAVSAVFTGKDGPTILLKSDPSGPTLVLGPAVDKESAPMVKLSADDKESSVQVFPSESQTKKRWAELVSNADGSFLGIQKNGEIRGEIAFSEANADQGAYASFTTGAGSTVLNDVGMTLLQDKQTVVALSLDKNGGSFELNSLSGEHRIFGSVSDGSDGVLGLYGPNGRSTVIGHGSR